MGSDVLGGFLKGFAAGWAMMPSKDEREYAKAKTAYTRAMADYYANKGGTTATEAQRIKESEHRITDRDRRFKDQQRRTDAYVAGQGKSKSTSTDVGLGDPELVDNLDVEEQDPESYYESPDDIETAMPEPEPIPEFSRGGVVPPPKKRRKMMRYANGGGVVQDEDPPVAIPPVTSNAAAKGNREPVVTQVPTRPVPLGPTAPNSARLTPSAPGMPQTVQPPRPEAIPGVEPLPQGGAPAQGMPKAPPGFSYTAGYDAAVAGLEDVAKDHKLDLDKPDTAVPDGKPDKKVEAFVKDTKDMASPDQLEQLRQKFDPGKKLSMDQVNMKVAAGVFETYMKMGDPAKATKAAAALVKAYRVYFNRHKALAEAAAKNGQVDEALRNVLQAHAYVPDGMEVKLQKTKDGSFAYQYVDNKTGKLVSRGVKSPDEMLSFVTNGGIGTFEQLLDQAAGDPSVKAFEDAPSPAALKGMGLEGGSGPGDGAVGVPTPGPYKSTTEASAVAEHQRRTSEAANRRLDEAVGAGDGKTKETPFRVTSQAELDQLPPGAWVVVNGRVGQKQAPKAAP